MRGWSFTRIMGMAIFYVDQCSVEMKEMLFVENTISTLTNIALPNINYHQYGSKYQLVKDTIIVGKTPWFDCNTEVNYKRDQRDLIRGLQSGKPYEVAEMGSMIGFTPPAFLSKYLLSPEKHWTITISFPGLRGSARYEGK